MYRLKDGTRERRNLFWKAIPLQHLYVDRKRAMYRNVFCIVRMRVYSRWWESNLVILLDAYETISCVISLSIQHDINIRHFNKSHTVPTVLLVPICYIIVCVFIAVILTHVCLKKICCQTNNVWRLQISLSKYPWYYTRYCSILLLVELNCLIVSRVWLMLPLSLVHVIVSGKTIEKKKTFVLCIIYKFYDFFKMLRLRYVDI